MFPFYLDGSAYAELYSHSSITLLTVHVGCTSCDASEKHCENRCTSPLQMRNESAVAAVASVRRLQWEVVSEVPQLLARVVAVRVASKSETDSGTFPSIRLSLLVSSQALQHSHTALFSSDSPLLRCLFVQSICCSQNVLTDYIETHCLCCRLWECFTTSANSRWLWGRSRCVWSKR